MKSGARSGATGPVLKEISLIEVLPDESIKVLPDQNGHRDVDDLPLRFALRALILKVKLAIGHGRYASGDQVPVLPQSVVRDLVDSRIKGETGLSFDGIGEFITRLGELDGKIGVRSSIGLKAPLLSLVDDLFRILGTNTESAPLSRPADSSV
jgi:hypothetical protein